MGLSRRHRREFALLLAVALMLGALLLWARLAERREVLAREGERLVVQARAVEQSLTQQLQGIHAALVGLRDDLPGWAEGERASRAVLRMEALRDVMASVQALQWVGAEGRVLASSQAADIGRDERAAAWLAGVRAQGTARVLVITPPGGSDGALRVSLAMPPPGPGAAALSATVDPAFLDALLGPVVYAADVGVAVLHGQGAVLHALPPGAAAPAVAEADAALQVRRRIDPAGLALDQPLELLIRRDVATALAPWRRQSELIGGFYAAALVAAALTLRTLQRRRDEQQRRVDAQREREAAEAERLRLALAGGDLALWDLDVAAQRSTVNERWSTMLGYAVGEVQADDAAWQSLIHPDDRERVVAAQNAHMAGATPAFEATYRMRHKDGHWVWVLDRGRVLQRDAQGRPLRMVGTHMDISERVAAEETLRRSEESLAITLQSIGDGVIATDAQGRVTRLNDAARRLTGWAGDSALGQPLAEVFRIVDATTRAPEPDPVQRVLARQATVTLDNTTLLVARDGGEHQIADSAAPIRAADGGIVGVVVVFSDVTEQYRIVQALRLSEQKSRALLAALESGVVVHDADTRIVDANPAACRILGLTLDQMQGRQDIDPAWAFLEEDGSPMALERFPVNQVRGSGAAVRDLVVGMRRPDLRYPMWALCSAFPLHDAQGRLQQVVVAFADFTERKLAQEALARSEARLRLAGRLARLGGFRVELPGGEVWLAAEAATILEAEPGQPLAASQLLPLLAPPQAAQLQQALDAGAPFDVEVEARSLHGRALQLRAIGEPVHDAQGRVVAMQGALQDVTEARREQQQLRHLEQQLREAQKIESIGTLAGGIAHDFNNILAAILGNVALARDDLPADHPALASLEQITRAGQRARSLVQQILTFSRRETQALVTQPLQPVVEETLALLRATLPASVQLQSTLAAEPLPVRADATQLQQVLMNLCTNAWHALPEGRGEIRVGLARATAAEVAAGWPDGAPAGACARLWVADNGIGMDAATRERVFDPFFTTKPVGQGTGLGLSVVHGIVRGHGGRIRVDSAPGRGSTFHVLLPLDAPAPGAVAVRAVAAPPPPGRHVLYVDDDEVMALVVMRLLQRAGYEASTCAGGPQALEQVRDAPWRYDIVVTDHNMPEMTGIELAHRLARLRATLPVVINSGYVTEALRREAQGAGVRVVLQKEHTLERLASVVHEVLAGLH